LFKTIEGVLDSLLSQVESILPKIPNLPGNLLKNHLDDLRTNWEQDKSWSPDMDSGDRAKLYSGWKKAVSRTLNWIE